MLLTLALLPILATATQAQAQVPICRSLGADEKVVVSCRPFSLFPTARFLADFSVDQLFKPAPPPLTRTILDLVQLFEGKEIVDNPDWKTFAAALPPVRFQQLDRTTGTVVGDFGDSTRDLAAPLEKVDGNPTLTVKVPPVLQGGYWRGPDALQMAFWEKQRIAVKLAWRDGPSFEGEIDCVSMTPDGVLIRFTPATTPPVLMLFRDCPA
jgi:hypothetical protein